MSDRLHRSSSAGLFGTEISHEAIPSYAERFCRLSPGEPTISLRDEIARFDTESLPSL
jgi:hypothetical protein